MGIDALQVRMEEYEKSKELLREQFANSYPSENGLKIPEIMVLYYARTFWSDQKTFQSFWQYRYGIEDAEVLKILDLLVERGFIVIGSAIDGIENYKIDKLKKKLEQYDLKKTGNKKDLINRIVSNISEEELNNAVTSKPYDLTALGIEELENNQYIPFFHRTHCEFGPSLNVLWMNKELHNHPNYKTNWKDLIWRELSKQTGEARNKMKKGDCYWYIHNRFIMAQFAIENERYKTALPLLTEAAYYQINLRIPKSYLTHCRLQAEIHEEMPNIRDEIFLFPNEFMIIKKEMCLNDEDLAFEIRSSAVFKPVQGELVSIGLLSAWILAFLMKNDTQLDFLCKKYSEEILKNG